MNKRNCIIQNDYKGKDVDIPVSYIQNKNKNFYCQLDCIKNRYIMYIYSCVIDT